MGQAVWPLADPVAPHLHTDGPEEQRGVKQAAQPRAPARGDGASSLWLGTPVGVGPAVGETPGLAGEVVGGTHRGLERAQARPLGNQHQGGPV